MKHHGVYDSGALLSRGSLIAKQRVKLKLSGLLQYDGFTKDLPTDEQAKQGLADLQLSRILK
jgi:hypothetical protein